MVEILNNVINIISRLGYSKENISTVYWRLRENGVNFHTKEDAVQKVIGELNKHKMDQKQRIVQSISNLDMISRLKEVVTIPSIVDVCNGLYRWYNSCSENDVCLYSISSK